MFEQGLLERLKSLVDTYETSRNVGKKVSHPNQFGDTSLLMDTRLEEKTLEICSELDLPLRVVSEEHGDVDLVSSPEYLAVLDGLDGSSVFRDKEGIGRYGTMFSIFSNTDPEYKDYLLSVVLEYSPSPRIFFATKGKGSFLFQNDIISRISCSDEKVVSPRTRVYVDESWEVNRITFMEVLKGRGISLPRNRQTGSSAAHYADLALGNVDLVLECTRKRNLELAAAYGLISEGGGQMYDLTGKDLGNQRYLNFSQDLSEHIPIVSAGRLELVTDFISKLN